MDEIITRTGQDGGISVRSTFDIDIQKLADKFAKKIGNAIDSAILEDPAIVDAIEKRGWHRSFGCKCCTPQYQDAPTGDDYSLDFHGARHKGILAVRCEWDDHGIEIRVPDDEIGRRWSDAFVEASYCPFCGAEL